MAEFAEGDDEALLMAEAEIGEKAREFVESDLGKTLIGMAEQETKSAEEELTHADASDVKTIMALQNQARLGLRFKGWLIELINKGEEALVTWRNDNAG